MKNKHLRKKSVSKETSVLYFQEVFFCFMAVGIVEN